MRNARFCKNAFLNEKNIKFLRKFHALKILKKFQTFKILACAMNYFVYICICYYCFMLVFVETIFEMWKFWFKLRQTTKLNIFINNKFKNIIKNWKTCICNELFCMYMFVYCLSLTHTRFCQNDFLNEKTFF